jgi:aminoglycoside/choline kinase family phosphotransferase
MTIQDAGAQGDELQGRIDRFLQSSGLGAFDARVLPLAGDASDRRYFRVTPADGTSFVLAVHAEPFDASRLPFLNVADLFRRIPLPIPEVLGQLPSEGVLAQEDLGDVTLQAHLASASLAEKRRRYQEATSMIARLQTRGAELHSDHYLPYLAAFDVDKLTWELRFFVQHFLEGYRQAQLSDDERAELEAAWAPMVQELSDEPRVVCHRDFHSRNLMLHKDRLYIIDFQDARMGPDTYDLVSLLRDSYIDISEGELEELVAHFLTLKQSGSVDAGEFRRRFDVMALQRNLKALGTFGYQTLARASTVYVQYMPRTLAYARTNLAKYPRLKVRHFDAPLPQLPALSRPSPRGGRARL